MTTTTLQSLPKRPITVCLLQPALRRDDQSPLESTRETIAWMQQAVADTQRKQHTDPRPKSVDLILLPELCPIGYSEDTFARFLPNSDENRVLHSQIDDELQNAARRMNCAICYGTIGWKPNETNTNTKNNGLDDEYTIRQVVVDHEGHQIACYDKIHVCDYGDCMETRFFSPGTKPCSFTLLNDWNFGLMICADMRYPHLVQNLVQKHHAHALLQPASFARDVSFRTWKSFRETRAVECGTYFLANNYAGDYFGQTSVNPPWIDDDHEPVVLGTQISYIVETLEPRVLEDARTQFPFYRHTMESNSCASCCRLDTPNNAEDEK
jgi:predicted amidohydrolase